MSVCAPMHRRRLDLVRATRTCPASSRRRRSSPFPAATASSRTATRHPPSPLQLPLLQHVRLVLPRQSCPPPPPRRPAAPPRPPRPPFRSDRRSELAEDPFALHGILDTAHPPRHIASLASRDAGRRRRGLAVVVVPEPDRRRRSRLPLAERNTMPVACKCAQQAVAAIELELKLVSSVGRARRGPLRRRLTAGAERAHAKQLPRRRRRAPRTTHDAS